MNILVVDDDPDHVRVLCSYLTHEGYEVTEVQDGVEALVRAPQANLVILDLNLPKLDGWEVARALGRDLPDLPILMLTASGTEDDKVRGLELGADDYVVKPFSPSEVVARVRALLRRVGVGQELRYGDLLIFPKSREVYRSTDALTLTRLEFNLLLTMAQHPGLVWSRERLLERVWDLDFPGTTRAVDARVTSLRKKLRGEMGGDEYYIETVHEVGYRFRDL